MNENLINELRKAYTTTKNTDALANDITKLFNQLEKEKQEEEKRQLKSEKQTYIDTIDKRFHDHYKQEKLDFNDVADLALLVLNSDKPDLTIKNLDSFRFAILDFTSRSGKLAGMNPKDTFNALMEELRDIFKQEEKEKESGKVSNAEPKGGAVSFSFDTDSKAIEDFLKSIF